ncbi:MAG TPA: Rne/Rng family ribonuclease [Candidatus Acidoferrales bacterium]|nr:Rne/Rng family ribonuclease [Candidatus Acidoferrales bacterium]
MSKEMVISANPHETRVAILEEGQLCEYYVEREKEFALVGSIYKGRVTRVLPGMQSSFVDIGLDSDAFLYVTDFLEGIEEFDPIVTTVEEKVQKMEDQGGAVFTPEGGAAPALEPPDVESAQPPDAAIFETGGAQQQPAPTAAPPPASYAAPPSRGQFENRNRGGRDFGRRGGRSGGHGGGDRRFGRELPPSKYASPRPYGDQPAESGAVGHLDIVLPGESLAKFRERPAGEAAPPAPIEAAAPAAPPVEAHEPVQEAAAPAAREFRPEFRRETRPEFPPSSSGLEPLPGETLAKWKRHEPEVVEHAEPAPPAGSEEAEEEHILLHEEPETHEARIVHEEHATAELSEDEAAALAEHVAEAQNEEAARQAQERVFAAADEAADAAQETAEAEEHELEEEEAGAETEGMISALPEPSHHVSAEEHELDRQAAAAEDQADAEAEARENLQSLGETEHTLELEAGVAPTEGELPIPAENPLAEEQQPSRARVRDDFRARMQHPARRGGRDRGRRDERGRRPQHGRPGGHGNHRTQPRRPQLIADLLKQGQEIIVQIAKEPLGKKGARITSHVALPGRFLVYMPTLDHTGVSRKIASAEDRARLRHLVNDAKGSAGGGFIVRTAAGSAAPEEVRADVEFLTKTWSEIKARSEQRKAPSILHRDLNLVERMLRDHISSDYAAIWVDSEEEYTKVIDFMSRFQPGLVNRVKLYTKENPVFEEFGIQQEIDKGLRPKVWLKSGGYIVINHTEALVAIDVNTGKFVGKGSNRLEDTIVRTNLEAVKEIVRQMRLRDLGGIIIIDFIDMEERRNREKVMAALEDALKADRAPSKMLRFNEFGLIAITRKRTKQALERMLSQPCPYCTGSGMVKSIPTLCYEIQTEARKMAPEMDSGSITLRVHPEIAKALKTRESSLIEELERWTKKSAIIQADPTLHWEQYDIY